jgi:cytochrome c oxidase assembly protein subunit 11
VTRPSPPGSRNTRVALLLIWAVAGMVTLTYVAVPVYRLYRKVTGYNGTAQSASAVPGRILSREITVRFDSNTQPNLPWTFKPDQISQTIHIGEVALAHFHVRNNASIPITASAVFNVDPPDVGKYFNKISCFCYTAQTLLPGEEKDLSVSYFIDPKLAQQRRLDGVQTATLSYTFYRRDDLAVDN